MKTSTRSALLAALILLSCSLSAAQAKEKAREIIGSVTRVFDGDSLLLRVERGGVIEVRLAGIDAPEKDQPHADDARDALRDLALDRTLRLRVVDQDKYGRQVAIAYQVGDGRELNAELVREGHAWVYRNRDQSDSAQERALLVLEEEARVAKRGLWALAESELVPPWQWRQEHPREQPQIAPDSQAR